MKNHQRMLIRVPYFLQIRVSCILQTSKKVCQNLLFGQKFNFYEAVKSQLDGKNSSHPKMHKYDGICSITKRFLLFLVTTRFWVAILHLLYVFQLVTHPATIKNNKEAGRRLSPQTKLDF